MNKEKISHCREMRHMQHQTSQKEEHKISLCRELAKGPTWPDPRMPFAKPLVGFREHLAELERVLTATTQSEQASWVAVLNHDAAQSCRVAALNHEAALTEQNSCKSEWTKSGICLSFPSTGCRTTQTTMFPFHFL